MVILRRKLSFLGKIVHFETKLLIMRQNFHFELKTIILSQKKVNLMHKWLFMHKKDNLGIKKAHFGIKKDIFTQK